MKKRRYTTIKTPYSLLVPTLQVQVPMASMFANGAVAPPAERDRDIFGPCVASWRLASGCDARRDDRRI